VTTRRLTRSHARAAVAAVVGAGTVFLLSAVGGVGQVGAACAQVPTIPGIPTLGPIDPACQRVPDTDADGVFDFQDNCQGSYNPSQKDTDGDAGPKPYQPVKVFERDPVTGGDSCDVDDDGDGIKDVSDVCPKVADKTQVDTDGDGVGDACDPTPTVPNQAGGSPTGPTGGTAGVAPKLTVRGLRTVQRLAELQAGLAVPARCSAPCALTGRLSVDRATARRLGGSTTILSRATGGLERAGNTFVFLRLSPATRAKLRRAGRVRVSVHLVAADEVGHRSTVQRRVTVTR
jgi:hypothetical protein